MPRPGRNHLWHNLRHRPAAGLALLAYVMVALGVPLPAALPAKDRSQPFPCQDRACGCRNAEECWRRCCCFSAAERQAWARSHGVTPPPDAEKPVTAGWQSPRQRDLAVGSVRCPACCSRETASACGRSAPAPSDDGKRGTLSLSVLQCQGLATLWINTGAVLPPSPCSCDLQFPFVAWITPSHPLRADHGVAPPVPPPRLAHL